MLEAFCRLNGWQWYLWYLVDGPQIDETVANKITIARAKAAFYFCSPLYAIHVMTGVWLFAFASVFIAIACGIADAVDGWAARTYGCPSESGECLDPAADGILVVWGGFVPIILEHHFAWEFLVPIVGIVGLGCVIFRRRIKTGAKTHLWAKVTMFTIYVAGVACFVAILAKLGGAHLLQFTADAIGLSLFLAAFLAIIVSTLGYYNVHQRALGLVFRRYGNVN